MVPLFCHRPSHCSRLSILNKMKASDELDEEQRRQMAHDLENSYSSFHKSLSA